MALLFTLFFNLIRNCTIDRFFKIRHRIHITWSMNLIHTLCHAVYLFLMFRRFFLCWFNIHCFVFYQQENKFTKDIYTTIYWNEKYAWTKSLHSSKKTSLVSTMLRCNLKQIRTSSWYMILKLKQVLVQLSTKWQWGTKLYRISSLPHKPDVPLKMLIWKSDQG